MRWVKYLSVFALCFVILLVQCDICWSSPSKNITVAEVKDMLIKAQNLVWEYRSGGESGGIPHPDIGYRYLDPSIDTKDKFIKYFCQVFTADSTIDYFKNEINQGALIEKNNRLLQANADYGTIYDASSAVVRFIKENGNTREYIIKVYGFDESDWIEQEVILEFGVQVGWKIATSPELLAF